MKSKSLAGLFTMIMVALTFTALAQKSSKIDYWRPYDQRGINIFEPAKQVETQFEGLQVRIGGAFAQQFQALKHSNEADPKPASSDPKIDLNQLAAISDGFNLATANLYLDAQLEDGIRVAVEGYMSSRHHEEFWVKGGYIQIDKLPMFGNPQWFSDYLRVKIGHFQVNYGDQQFRRTDNAEAIYNPFVGNYIMDAFATEIGGEAYLFPTPELMFMAGITNGLIKGDISEGTRKPSIYAKAAYDSQLNEDFRFRLSGSVYHNPESGRNTLYSGDRAGSRFYMVMEPAFDVPRGGGAPVASSPTENFTSGRFNPGFSTNVTAFQINPFFKFKGLEFFGTFENSSGYSSSEGEEKRTVKQYAAELLYRFLPNEQLYIGGRYNTLTGELSPDLSDASIDRFEIAAGWYPVKNLLLKAEYVNQTYNDFQPSDLEYRGEFDGFIIEAVVGF